MAGVIGQALDIEPDGTVFGLPATVTLVYQDAGLPPGALEAQLKVVKVQPDGSASKDPDKDPLGYQWALISKTAESVAALSDSAAASPALVADRPGTYTARLIVSDGALSSEPDEVTIITVSRPPIARAGPDQSVREGDAVQLSGKASSDPDGDPLSFQWTLIARPDESNAALSDPSSAEPVFAADLPGDYEARLIVSDGNLIATTQSARNEGAIKVVIDNVSDLAVDMVSTALLTALTEREWLAACGGEVLANIPGALTNLGVGLLGHEAPIGEHPAFGPAR
ncbi:MAG: hypothetical protein HY717_14970 [Planctomycetes bacterium]|nr:hypothetical protein [Planctomycetota bacterium]